MPTVHLSGSPSPSNHPSNTTHRFTSNHKSSKHAAKVLTGANLQRVFDTYGKLPLGFETNVGQTDPQVKFLSRGPGYTLFLTPTESALVIGKPASPNADFGRPDVVRIEFVGAEPAARIEGLEALSGKSNYFIGNDPKQWHRDVRVYAKVKYRDLYPGVDLVYYGGGRQLEYDFIVAPGNDPATIAMKIGGTKTLDLDVSGDLLIETAEGQLRMRKPMIYQNLDGITHEVTGGYTLNGSGEVAFRIGRYDLSKPLVIDPVLAYSTYLGGNGFDAGFNLAVDSVGSAYIVGPTSSSNFPTAGAMQPSYGGGVYDCYVAKLTPTGSALVYSTYLGGSAYEDCGGIAVDVSGKAYVSGASYSDNFPIVNAFQTTRVGLYNAFVAKLNSAGNALVYSTYLGGHGTGDGGSAIAVDAAGNAYVAGGTSSFDFPVTAGAFQTAGGGYYGDAFVAKFSPSGALLYSTYLGGTGDPVSGEAAYGIAVDTLGHIYVTGAAVSTNFPTTSGAFQSSLAGQTDAFVAKLDPAGNGLADLVYSTYLGGSSLDFGYDIAVDTLGNTYITGTTCSPSFPTKNPLQPAYAGGACGNASGGDVFVSKLNASGSALVYSTYLGGTQDDYVRRLKVDAAGNAYVVGTTSSPDFPTKNPIQNAAGGQDVFVAELNPDGNALVFSTYVGGSDNDGGGGIALDGSGGIYLTGATASTNFPATPGAFQTTFAGNYDAFVTKIQMAHADLWIGLKNSDDQGTQFDLRAEVYKNGTIVSAGETRCVTGVTRNPSLATQVTVPVEQLAGFAPGDSLSLKLLTRIGTNPDETKCSGPGGSHSNAVGLRLYYDSTNCPSELAATISSNPATDYFLHSVGVNRFLDPVPPTAGTAKFQDSAAINFATGNPWKEIGTWTMTVQ